MKLTIINLHTALVFSYFYIFFKRILWGIGCLSVFFPLSLWATSNKVLFEQGQGALQQGQFEQAIAYWQMALDPPPIERSLHLDILTQLATTYQTLGMLKEARIFLEHALSLAKNDELHQTVLLSSLSDLFLTQHHLLKSREYADQSVSILPPHAPNLVKAMVFNNLGNLLTVEAYYEQALHAYKQSFEFAQQTHQFDLLANIQINRALVWSKLSSWQNVATSLGDALQYLGKIEEINYSRAFGLTSIGIWALRYQKEISSPIQWSGSPLQGFKQLAFTALHQALEMAKSLHHKHLLSYIYGYLGQLYESEQRVEESLQLTRQAIFFTQQDHFSYFSHQNQVSEVLYRWQWQLGRLLKTQHQVDKAIEAYRHAVDSLHPIRWQLTLGYRTIFDSFREMVGDVYFELAELLLQKADEDVKNKVNWLNESLRILELLKSAELQDYFQDDCVTEFQSKRISLDKSIPNTAVIYPILLPQRLELLVRLPNGIERFSVPVSFEQLKDTVNEFRFELESTDSQTFFEYAQRLHRWLIAPLQTTLKTQNIETLVVIPDGVLRTIPFAALYDGTQFLISQYAIAVTPGLTLTGHKPKGNDSKILAAGLSASVEGYSKLLSVQDELSFIRELHGKNVTILLNEEFTMQHFTDTLSKTVYSMVHIASHGEFDSDAQKTFLLSYDGKISVDHLEQLIRLSKIRNESMELLTLSACQTAVGDDQAALGLAGLAIKAGASSALASLWFIDDRATSQLMREFYRQLSEKNVSKAKALQKAQQNLLKQPRYQHPAFWAPFLLIGNWL